MSGIELEIRQFVDSLADASMPSDDLVNIYSCEARCQNLVRFLNRSGQRPSALFVGEAPGRSGAAVTGVPFTAVEQLRLLSTDCAGAFVDAGFCPPSGYRTERTAKTFWQEIVNRFDDLPLPMAWNAVPFWPRGNDKNRKPRSMEMDWSAPWLKRIIEMYSGAMVFAVGRVAEEALERIGRRCVYIPHPSRRASGFRDGVVSAAEQVRRCRR